MDITVAYFHPLFHPEMVKRDFEQIRASGANSIVYAVHEEEEQRWGKDLERGLRQAQDAGLKIILSLGRYGNLFAGPSHMPSWYTFRHPQSRVQDRHGRHHGMTCYNHEPFRSWLLGEIEFYLKNYPISGLLIDEPRGPEITCYCPVCRALCPDITDLEHFRRRSMVDFFGELFESVKRINSRISTTIVLLPQDMELMEELGTIPELDTVGCHLFWQLLGEDVAKVEEWGRKVVELTKKQGKRSQLWLQNYNLREAEESELESAFKKLCSADPDEIACYYYWRNNERPEQVWETTKGLLRRIPRKQLFWRQPTLSPIPAITLPGEKHVDTGSK